MNYRRTKNEQEKDEKGKKRKRKDELFGIT